MKATVKVESRKFRLLVINTTNGKNESVHNLRCPGDRKLVIKLVCDAMTADHIVEIIPMKKTAA